MHFSHLPQALTVLGLVARAFAGPIEARTTTCNRDNVFRCLLGATPTASAFCSSLLSYGTQTVYTSTFTPTTVATAYTTQVTTTVTSTTSTTTTTTTDFTTTTTTAATTTDTTAVFSAVTTTTITVIPPLMRKRDVVTASRVYSEFFGTTALPRRNIEARATSSPAPACLAQYSAPASRLSSACSCLTGSLAITSATITTVSTAPLSTTTTTIISSSTETDISSTTEISTSDVTSTATSTISTTETDLFSTTTTSTFVATVTQKCADCYLCSSNSDCRPGFECALYIGFPFGQGPFCSNMTPGGKDYVCGAICTN
ncbi:MAG: hypothetical protein M1824_005215 [Vezdaea acicularis]|nr:MAG: hypothetical protein M1824_005215 [Vezdaea acicularis]